MLIEILAHIVFLAILGVWFYASNGLIRDAYYDKSIAKADAIMLHVMVNSVGLIGIIIVLAAMVA
jgi:hypothetical protein